MNLEPPDVEYEFSDGWGPFGFGRVIDHHDSNGHRIVVDDDGNEHDIDDHDWGPDFTKERNESTVKSHSDFTEEDKHYENDAYDRKYSVPDMKDFSFDMD